MSIDLINKMMEQNDTAFLRGNMKATASSHLKFYEYLSQQALQFEMSLPKIRNKVRTEYLHPLQVGNDIRILLNKAISFFSSTDKEGIAANSLLKYFENEFQKILTGQLITDDDNMRTNKRLCRRPTPIMSVIIDDSQHDTVLINKEDKCVQAENFLNYLPIHVKEAWIDSHCLACTARIYNNKIQMRLRKSNVSTNIDCNINADELIRIIFFSSTSTFGIILLFCLPECALNISKIISIDNNTHVFGLVLHKLDISTRCQLHGYLHQLSFKSIMPSLYQEVNSDVFLKILNKSIHSNNIQRYYKSYRKINNRSNTMDEEFRLSQENTKNLTYQSSGRSSMSSSIISNDERCISPITILTQDANCELNLLPNAVSNSEQSQSVFINSIFTDMINSSHDVVRRENIMEDDIIMTSQTISTKCPITQKQMQEPLLNIKCKHNYDRVGILSLLQSRNGKQTKCPVSGCNNKNVILSDLLPNIKLKNNIGR